jgi:hypothetical protein
MRIHINKRSWVVRYGLACSVMGWSNTTETDSSYNHQECNASYGRYMNSFAADNEEISFFLKDKVTLTLMGLYYCYLHTVECRLARSVHMREFTKCETHCWLCGMCGD